MKIETLQSINYDDLIENFEKHTNWSSVHNGFWNADFNKIVFNINLGELFRREQDWMVFVYVDINNKSISEDSKSLLKEDNFDKYKESRVYNLYLSDIINWMIKNKHLPYYEQYLVSNM
jgi:hypothetical protein